MFVQQHESFRGLCVGGRGCLWSGNFLIQVTKFWWNLSADTHLSVSLNIHWPFSLWWKSFSLSYRVYLCSVMSVFPQTIWVKESRNEHYEQLQQMEKISEGAGNESTMNKHISTYIYTCIYIWSVSVCFYCDTQTAGFESKDFLHMKS